MDSALNHRLSEGNLGDLAVQEQSAALNQQIGEL
jgi:hypothetical protein